MSKVLELFGIPTNASVNWRDLTRQQHCPYLDRTCIKVRKSEPDIAIGSCTVRYGAEHKSVIICPYRLLDRKQIFTDCIHLLTLHQPGNEFHIVSEFSVPGGSIDYFLVSAKKGKVEDFVGIELQTLDTTGTVWPERQRFLKEHGLTVDPRDADSPKTFGMNWKMTAKTILVQLHHKIETFEGIGKHLVLAVQNHLLDYMRREFAFSHLTAARLGDPMHIHSYSLTPSAGSSPRLTLELVDRVSTDTKGIASCLGLQVSPKVELDVIIRMLESKISADTLFSIASPTPVGLKEDTR